MEKDFYKIWNNLNKINDYLNGEKEVLEEGEDTPIHYYNDPVEVVNSTRGLTSIYGNAFQCITLEQIKQLLNGKIIFFEMEEYSCFIRCLDLLESDINEKESD